MSNKLFKIVSTTNRKRLAAKGIRIFINTSLRQKIFKYHNNIKKQ